MHHIEIFIHQSFYPSLKDLITFVLTVAGLIIAGMGLATWKKQIKGTKEYEIAYDLHYSVLKLRDAIKYVRNPGILPSESSKAVEYSKTKYPTKSEEDLEENSNASVYEMRWEDIITASTEMESHLLGAEVLWGTEIVNLIRPLNRKIVDLNIALREYFQPDLRTRDYMEIHKIIYDQDLGGSEGDDFTKEVNEAVQGITDYLKTRIS